MPKYYEAYEKRYRQVHEKSLSWASDKNSPIVSDTLKKYVKGDSPKILDIGCGEGRDCLYLMKQGYDVQAIDISEEAIRYCKQKAGAENESRFRVLDVCRSKLEERFDFIYSVATLHMLVVQQDRERYLSFIKNHLSDTGYALILSMGDGEMESESNIDEAFEDKTRIHQETGTELSVASTSCKMVSFGTLRKELHSAGFSVVEDGLTEAPPDFPVIMYAVVRLPMLETPNLILDKAKSSDWKDMYYNVWSRPEAAKYMSWRLSESEEDARERMLRTIEFQKTHDTYNVYEKASGKAIGFAGVEKLADGVYGEMGICLGPDFVGKGYGKQILRCLIDYCKREFGANEFIYSTREGNEASHGLARSLGFTQFAVEAVNNQDGSHYNLVKYSLKL